MAFKTLGGVNILVEWDGMDCGAGARREQSDEGNRNPQVSTKFAGAVVSSAFAEPDAVRDQLHADSEGKMLP
jgi:hypothetical protein